MVVLSTFDCFFLTHALLMKKICLFNVLPALAQGHALEKNLSHAPPIGSVIYYRPTIPKQQAPRRLKAMSTADTSAVAAAAGGLAGAVGGLGIYLMRRKGGRDNPRLPNEEEDQRPPSPSNFQVALSTLYNESFGDEKNASSDSATDSQGKSSGESYEAINID